MQNGQSSKGKGKSIEWDLQSLSLSDCNDSQSTVPRSTSTDSFGTFALAPSPSPYLLVEQPYAESIHYRHDANSSERNPYASFLSQSPGTMTGNVQGSNSAFNNMDSGASVYSDANWDTISHSSTATATTAQGSIFSSNTLSTGGGSSEPGRISHLDTHINRQPPPRQRYQLPCEFQTLGCPAVFNGDEQMEWINHTDNHLGGNFPSKLRCWFCDDLGFFDAKAVGGDRRYNFQVRMDHIREHILAGDFGLQDMRADGYLVSHLKKQGLIDEQQYQTMLRPARAPPAAGGSHHHHHHHHRSSGHRHLPPVVEEAGPSSGSRSSDRRAEGKGDKKRGHTRDSHHRKKSTK